MAGSQTSQTDFFTGPQTTATHLSKFCQVSPYRIMNSGKLGVGIKEWVTLLLQVLHSHVNSFWINHDPQMAPHTVSDSSENKWLQRPQNWSILPYQSALAPRVPNCSKPQAKWAKGPSHANIHAHTHTKSWFLCLQISWNHMFIWWVWLQLRSKT